jgi:hypothetical protein
MWRERALRVVSVRTHSSSGKRRVYRRPGGDTKEDPR